MEASEIAAALSEWSLRASLRLEYGSSGRMAQSLPNVVHAHVAGGVRAMLIQVVHCHPLADSYNHALFEVVVASLEQRGHQVIATDLYREGFQPAMTEAERQSYMGRDYDGHAVADYIDTLKKIDGHHLLLSALVVLDAGCPQGICR